MIMSRKIFVVTAVAVSIFGGLFYLFAERDNEVVAKKDVNPVRSSLANGPDWTRDFVVSATSNGVNTINQLVVSWQKITVTETEQKVVININAPRVVISNSYNLGSKVNEAIMRRIESLKDDFISAVSTAAEDNGETNTLNIDTEILLVTPRLISLAFTATGHLAGIKDNDPERTFLVFDLINDKLVVEGNELFRDDLAWSKAVKIIKTSLLSNYQESPSCDLLFAPKLYGFATSCIGVNWSQERKHLSITENIPISMIQEFLAPSVLSDIIQ